MGIEQYVLSIGCIITDCVTKIMGHFRPIIHALYMIYDSFNKLHSNNILYRAPEGNICIQFESSFQYFNLGNYSNFYQ